MLIAFVGLVKSMPASALPYLKRKPYSLSASSVLRDGDLNTGSIPEPVLGNAMTSRIDFEPVRMDTRRSKPIGAGQPLPGGVGLAPERTGETDQERCRHVGVRQT